MPLGIHIWFLAVMEGGVELEGEVEDIYSYVVLLNLLVNLLDTLWITSLL